MEAVVGEGVDRLDIVPHREGSGGVPVLAGREKPGADITDAPVAVPVGMVPFSAQPRPVYEAQRVLGADVDEGVSVVESLVVFSFVGLLKYRKCIQDQFGHGLTSNGYRNSILIRGNINLKPAPEPCLAPAAEGLLKNHRELFDR